MKHYLLDTNVCVYFLRNRYGVAQHIAAVGWENCCISEITVAELLYGAESSNDAERNSRLVEDLCNHIEVVPLRDVLRTYAREKTRLRRNGTCIDDLDLFIGSTAKAYSYILVTENLRHLNRIESIQIENWIER